MIVEKYSGTPNMELRRYTPEQQPIGKDYRYLNAAGERVECPIGKPMGSWISVPGEWDWPSWCRAEEFSLANLAYCHTYELDTTNVKMVSGLEQMIEFHREWGVEMEPLSGSPQYKRWNIRWADLSRQYAGIVISPYVWECRLGSVDSLECVTNDISNWYYGWDCASGCIWTPEVLRIIESTWTPPPRTPPRATNLDG